MVSNLRLWLCFVILIAASSSSVYAVEADIVGVVRDVSGGVLPGVTITGRSVDTGLVRTTTTDADGRYRLVSLPVGTYELRAELRGFQTVVRSGIVLTINMRADEDITLKVAGVEERRRSGGVAHRRDDVVRGGRHVHAQGCR
jgi:uncharacterized surface anchored protein